MARRTSAGLLLEGVFVPPLRACCPSPADHVKSKFLQLGSGFHVLSSLSACAPRGHTSFQMLHPHGPHPRLLWLEGPLEHLAHP